MTHSTVVPLRLVDAAALVDALCYLAPDPGDLPTWARPAVAALEHEVACASIVAATNDNPNAPADAGTEPNH